MAEPAVLVVDDEAHRLQQLADAIRLELGSDAGVKEWLPAANEDPLERFDSMVSDNVWLIATDQDLTKSGLGLLGSSVTAWAQDRFLPVCNFSRQARRLLPRERNFFELRVPRDLDELGRARYIARIFRGFADLRAFVAAFDDPRPTAELLAGAMGLPELQDDLAPFLTSVGSASSSFKQALVADGELDGQSLTDFLTFLLGHVIVNAVLEFPGPILPARALTAYCAVDQSASQALAELFSGAAYRGPFGGPSEYFVRSRVDARVDEIAGAPVNELSEVDQYNRAAVEAAIGELARHGCTRCYGDRGGLWCPFTERAVCNRTDCSVASSAWIPRGATLCRIEKDHYDMWSPLLGE